MSGNRKGVWILETRNLLPRLKGTAQGCHAGGWLCVPGTLTGFLGFCSPTEDENSDILKRLICKCMRSARFSENKSPRGRRRRRVCRLDPAPRAHVPCMRSWGSSGHRRAPRTTSADLRDAEGAGVVGRGPLCHPSWLRARTPGTHVEPRSVQRPQPAAPRGERPPPRVRPTLQGHALVSSRQEARWPDLLGLIMRPPDSMVLLGVWPVVPLPPSG